MTARREVKAHPGEPADFEDAIVAWRQYRKLIDQCNAENHRMRNVLEALRPEIAAMAAIEGLIGEGWVMWLYRIDEALA